MTRLLMVLAAMTITFCCSMPASAQQSGADTDAWQAAQTIVDAHNHAGRDRDVAGMSALYAANAFLVTPDGIVAGRNAIEKFLEGGFKVFESEARLERVELLGKSVRVRSGSWTGVFHAPQGPIPLKGYWSTTDAVEGGKWKIRMETFNTTPPPPVTSN